MTDQRKFICANCQQEFSSDWSEEKARAEQKSNGFAGVACVQVCDECYKAIMGWARKTRLHVEIN